MMSSLKSNQGVVTIQEKRYKKEVILADVNIPYKFSLDRDRNNLFFCINADEFSSQSFQSVALNLDSGLATVVPSMRNGFASAVDQTSGSVFLGGSDGIYRYNYDTTDIEKFPLVNSIDIFDMHFSKHLYFVDTANQNLHCYVNKKWTMVDEVKGYLIHHFVIDRNEELSFINPMGLFTLAKSSRSPVLCEGGSVNFRGATTDVNGLPYFIAQDGIYTIDDNMLSRRLVKILTLEDGLGLAFDKDNNIVYSNERTVARLVPFRKL